MYSNVQPHLTLPKIIVEHYISSGFLFTHTDLPCLDEKVVQGQYSQRDPRPHPCNLTDSNYILHYKKIIISNLNLKGQGGAIMAPTTLKTLYFENLPH